MSAQTDILSDLRKMQATYPERHSWHQTVKKAADEIELLRARLDNPFARAKRKDR